MTSTATDLAPILAMLDDCGFTRQHTGRAPTAYFYRRDVGEQAIDVTVYPWGNKPDRPVAPEPCVNLSVKIPARGYAQLWQTHFRAGTPAPVILAALSAAMHDAAGTQPPAKPVRVIITHADVGSAVATRIDHVNVQSAYTPQPHIDLNVQEMYFCEVAG